MNMLVQRQQKSDWQQLEHCWFMQGSVSLTFYRQTQHRRGFCFLRSLWGIGMKDLEGRVCFRFGILNLLVYNNLWNEDKYGVIVLFSGVLRVIVFCGKYYFVMGFEFLSFSIIYYSMFCCFSGKSQKKPVPRQPKRQDNQFLRSLKSTKKSFGSKQDENNTNGHHNESKKEDISSIKQTKSIDGRQQSRRSLKRFQNIENEVRQDEAKLKQQHADRPVVKKITTFGFIDEPLKLKDREQIAKNIDRFSDESQSPASLSELQKKEVKLKHSKKVKILEQMEEIEEQSAEHSGEGDMVKRNKKPVSQISASTKKEEKSLSERSNASSIQTAVFITPAKLSQISSIGFDKDSQVERKEDIEEEKDLKKARSSQAFSFKRKPKEHEVSKGQNIQNDLDNSSEREHDMRLLEQKTQNESLGSDVEISKSSLPKLNLKKTKSLEDIQIQVSSTDKNQFSIVFPSKSKSTHKSSESFRSTQHIIATADQFDELLSKGTEKTVHQEISVEGRDEPMMATDITLDNFRLNAMQIKRKIEEELDDEPLEENSQEALEAQNDFYCQTTDINEQFSRSVIAYKDGVLAKLFLLKMSTEERNKKDFKGYTPIQLVVLKALKENKQIKYFNLAKSMANLEDINLECKNPSGWTPLQESLLYRNIPLSTQLFRAGYMKRQKMFSQGLAGLGKLLRKMPNFKLDVKIKVDSFLPLVGAFAPDDVLRIRKIDNRIRIDYSLVGYQFPFCKRRQMSIFYDGKTMFGVNYSKNTFCDLLEPLDQEELILLIEDLLVNEIRKGEPIMHEIKLNKVLSLFDNEIKEQFGNIEAVKHKLELKYSSTADKKRSGDCLKDDLEFVQNYEKYVKRMEKVVILEKNRDKKVELEVWLAKKFGLQLAQLVDVLGVMGEGNSLLGKWSGFLKDEVGQELTKDNLFPVKIDIPLNYSLFFNIQFEHFMELGRAELPILLKSTLQKIPRKKFQNLCENKDKRKLFLEAYT